jgi:hypothetical protein
LFCDINTGISSDNGTGNKSSTSHIVEDREKEGTTSSMFYIFTKNIIHSEV